jgi:hypothetical protein
MEVICQTARLRVAQGFSEVCGFYNGKRPPGERGQPADPDAIAEATIGQLQFDVLTNDASMNRCHIWVNISTTN